jgi:hypothetical protein
MDWTRRNFWRFGQGDWADSPVPKDRHIDGDVNNPSDPMNPLAVFPKEDPNGRGIIRYILFLVQKIFLEGTSSFVDSNGQTVDAVESLRNEIKRLSSLMDPDEVPVSFLTYLARTIGYEFIFDNLILPSPVGGAWDKDTEYHYNSLVYYDGETYKSQINGNKHIVPTTVTDPPSWIVFPPLSSESIRRNELKWATQWYRLKGVPRGYEVLFESIGRDVTVLFVWSNKNDRNDRRYIDVRTRDIPAENKDIFGKHKPVNEWVYFPDSMIRIQPDFSFFISLIPAAFDDIVKRIDEVIPAHILYEIYAAVKFIGPDCDKDQCGDIFPITEDFTKFYLHILTDPLGIKPSPFTESFPWKPSDCLTHGSTCCPPPKHDHLAIDTHSDSITHTSAEWDIYRDAYYDHSYCSSWPPDCLGDYPHRGWCAFHNHAASPSWVYLETYEMDDFDGGVIDSGWDVEFLSKYVLDVRPPLSSDYCATLGNAVDHGVYWRLFSNINGDIQLDFNIKMSAFQNVLAGNGIFLRLIDLLGIDWVVVGVGSHTTPGQNVFVWVTNTNALFATFTWTPYKEVQLRIKRVGNVVTGYYNDGSGWNAFPDSHIVNSAANVDTYGEYHLAPDKSYSFSKFQLQAGSGFNLAGGGSVLHNNDCQTDKLWIYDHNDHSVPLYESMGYPY